MAEPGGRWRWGAGYSTLERNPGPAFQPHECIHTCTKTVVLRYSSVIYAVLNISWDVAVATLELIVLAPECRPSEHPQRRNKHYLGRQACLLICPRCMHAMSVVFMLRLHRAHHHPRPVRVLACWLYHCIPCVGRGLPLTNANSNGRISHIPKEIKPRCGSNR